MKNSKEVILVGNGENLCSNKIIKQFKKVVALDGGYKYIGEDSLIEVVIGDFDSMDLKKIPSKIKKLKFPKKKDFSDLELGIIYSIENGYDNIYVTGVTGTRMDHFYTSIMLLKKYSDKNIHILTKTEDIFLLKHNILYTFKGMRGKRVSFFSISKKSSGIDSSGLEYEYDDDELLFEIPIGLSNNFRKNKVFFKFKKGMILCFLEI